MQLRSDGISSDVELMFCNELHHIINGHWLWRTHEEEAQVPEKSPAPLAAQAILAAARRRRDLYIGHARHDSAELDNGSAAMQQVGSYHGSC